MRRLLLFSLVAGPLLNSATPLPSIEFDPSALQKEGTAGTFTGSSPPLAEPSAPILPYEHIELAAELAVPPEPPMPTPPAKKPVKEPVAPEEQPFSGGGVQVVVSIPQQKAYVFQDGEIFATSPVSTGKRGHATPTGSFRILEKKVHHRSNKYANAPMPYMQRLTWYGIAMHAGSLPGYPASHGCIRFPRSFAKKLYRLTDYGTKVTIVNKRPKSAEHALNLA